MSRPVHPGRDVLRSRIKRARHPRHLVRGSGYGPVTCVCVPRSAEKPEAPVRGCTMTGMPQNSATDLEAAESPGRGEVVGIAVQEVVQHLVLHGRLELMRDDKGDEIHVVAR